LFLGHVYNKGIEHYPIFSKGNIIWPVAEWPKTNLENHSQYRGEVDFNAVDRAGKLIKANPAEEMYCFLSTMYL